MVAESHPGIGAGGGGQPNEKIKKRIAKMLHPGEVPEGKRQRYLKPTQPPLSPASTDKELLRTYIAGTQFRDLDRSGSIEARGYPAAHP